MSDLARTNILNRLKHNASFQEVELPPIVPTELTQSEKMDQFQSMMEAVKTEVHRIQADQIAEICLSLIQQKGIQSLLYAPQIDLGKTLEAHETLSEKTKLVAYEESIETFKDTVFQVDAGITSVYAGIAETGTLVLWPTVEEPRLMSLVPPIHIAVIDAKTLYHNFRELLVKKEWTQQMPTNVLLISGPSKTGDIEFILEYGVHGPKEVIVLIVE